MIIDPITVKRTVDSSSEPLSVSEAKEHLRVTSSDDDTYISNLIKVARQSAEISTRRCLISGTTYVASYKYFPFVYNHLRIPNPPLVSVSHIKYYDLADNLQTLSSSEYIVESTLEDSALIGFNDAFTRPTLSRERMAPIQVQFEAGYTETPIAIKQAMLLLISHYYDTREPISFTGEPFKIPRSVDFLLQQYAIRSI